ncbi:F-box domain [Macleaya cordata]|uniref:F-box domain n=1 Tax=Macleaya cordata TaxID=56857 RepID=A0A200R9Q6_MACCD|nr:F-box domain [Macleaya cordata]
MGASLSNLTEGANGSTIGPGLGDIPESCVACVFMYLTPPEICNLARLNRAFRGAASSDAVWESKLPHNYQDLLDFLPPERYQNLSKKDIFALLSRSLPFDDGNKEVWLDRVTGGVCMAISAKSMAITGIEDRRYWNWIPTEESRILLYITNNSTPTPSVFEGIIPTSKCNLHSSVTVGIASKGSGSALKGLKGMLKCLEQMYAISVPSLGTSKHQNLHPRPKFEVAVWGFEVYGESAQHRFCRRTEVLSGETISIAKRFVIKEGSPWEHGVLLKALKYSGWDFLDFEMAEFWVDLRSKAWVLWSFFPGLVFLWSMQIWWFEVDGAVRFPFPVGIYTLSFRLHIGKFSRRLGRRVCNFEQTHGWDIRPVRFELSTSDGQQASCECCLDESERDDANGNQKRGCWIEYKVGEFIVTDSEPTTEVRFSMKQIDCTHSKGGLCVDAVYIIPSYLRERRRREVLK